MLFERVFIELNGRDVKYLVIGGLAVNLYGFARATGDMDIMISLENKNINKFLDAVKILGFKTRIPVNIEDFSSLEKRKMWMEEKNMQVFSVYNPKNMMEQLDIVLENDIDFETAYKRKETLTAGDIEIPVVSIDDLIKLKQIAGRERDELDIRALKKIKELRDEINSKEK